MTDEQEPSKRTQRRRVREWWHILYSNVPADFTPLEAVCAVKALDPDGNVNLVTVKTLGLSAWEAYGMLSYALDDFSSATINAATEED
jgi:hypothetical protein